MNTYDLAVAYRGVTTGDQSPPRPWAHLSHVGITSVSDVSRLTIDGYVGAAGFEIIANGKLYMVRVEEATL